MPYVNGVYMSAPGVAVIINDQNFNAAPSAGGLAVLVIGSVEDGKPNTNLPISSPAQAKSLLKGGDGLQAVLNVFDGAAKVGGSVTVNFIRPELATQATSNIKDSGGSNQIALRSTSYGDVGNYSKWMVQPGSTSGYKVSQATDFNGIGGPYNPDTTDNVALTPISIYYTGTGTSPTYTVSDTQMVLTATGGSNTGGTITFTPSMTVQQLANQINSMSGWNAIVMDPNPNDLVQNLFDNVTTATTVSTSASNPTSITAHVTAVVRYFNNLNLYFTAERQAGATSLATSSTWIYASGGTTPAATNNDWQNAYTTAQSVPGVALIGPASSSQTLWTYNDAHCQYMNSIGQPRRGYVGDDVGKTLSAETALVPNYNSNRTTIVWPEQQWVDYNGNPTTMAPYLVAFLIMGERAAIPAYEALTQQPIPSNGMGQAVTPAMVAQGLQAGLAVIAPNQQGVVVLQQDRTTWLQNTAYDKVENSTGLVADIITQDLLATLQPFIGRPVTPSMVAVAQSAVLSRLINWFNQGFLAVMPQASDVSLQASGNTITGSAKAAIDVPANYIVLQLIPTAVNAA
ncbi:MAG: hypothetical protein K6T83_03190 [Alicyclobacillus sp.]|nr:hypothetical protein [Alicyclobacillus sp.]